MDDFIRVFSMTCFGNQADQALSKAECEMRMAIRGHRAGHHAWAESPSHLYLQETWSAELTDSDSRGTVESQPSRQTDSSLKAPNETSNEMMI